MTGEYDASKCWIVAAVILWFLFGLWLTAPTEAQIKACMKSTGWTETHCKVELGK